MPACTGFLEFPEVLWYDRNENWAILPERRKNVGKFKGNEEIKRLMAIQMIGIDHTKAVIDIRTVFSFTKKRSAEALIL